MFCRFCGAAIQHNQTRCPRCGRELTVRRCPNCGNMLNGSASFCGKCGQALGQYAASSSQLNAKPPRKKGILIASVSVACVALAGFLVLFFTGWIPSPFSHSSNPFVTDDAQAFDFDEDVSMVIDGGMAAVPEVSGLSPVSGTVGTKITISGSNLGTTGLVKASLGESELVVSAIFENSVEAFVPYGALSGNIVLTFAGEQMDAGYFAVEAQPKQTLTEQEITPDNTAQTVDTGGLSVTIPGGAVDVNQTLKIEKITDPQPINLPPSVTGTAFSITLGNTHQFDDIVLITYTLPADAQGEPSVAYFNEETSLWNTLPSEVVNGELMIYTNHLTDIYIYCWGKSVYSPDGNFKIHYQEGDRFNYGSSMDDLARMVGETLEQIRKDYEAAIPAAYREDFSYMGFHTALDVYLNDEYGDGEYMPLTNNLHLMTFYRGQDDFETMLAHELFHAYQDAVWSELSMVGTMGKSENKWAVEALAELAAYEIAFPEKNRERLLTDGVCSQNPYNTVDMTHEYSMSCFLRYLLEKTDSTFVQLWIYVANSGKMSLDVSLYDFFKSQSNDFVSLEMSYMDFWKDVLGNAGAPMQAYPEMQFSNRKMYLKANQHTGEFRYQTFDASTTAFNLFAAESFSVNVPVRIFNVTCTANSAMCTKLSGIRNPANLNNLRVDNGFAWDHLYADPSLGNTHQLYRLEQGKDDMVIVGLESVQSNTPYRVQVSEIQSRCKPEKLENVLPGREYEIAVAFSGIFEHVGQVEIEIDFGDGTVQRFQKTNETGLLSGKIKHTFGNISRNTVTFTLYDVTQGNKEIISILVIPTTNGETATLSANPNPAMPGNPVSLATNIDEAGYTYQWDFGDGATDTTAGVAQSTHTYGNPGTYTTRVTILDTNGVLYGTAQQTVTVQAPVPTQTETTQTQTPDPIQGTDYSWLYGTWQCTSETRYNAPTNQIWYWVETLTLNSDGTFTYEFAPVVSDVAENETPSYDGVTNNIYEYESGGGTLRIFNEGESASGAFGYLFFDDGLNDGNLYLDKDTLIFSSSIFTKIQ